MTTLNSVRPDCARFVGGCVRNALQGLPANDIDIATQLKPDQVIKVLEAAGIRTIPTGIEHGTITAVHDSFPVEITTLRRDVETDGRRAVTAFSESWEEDAQRRDFRFNAIYASADGTLHELIEDSIFDAIEGNVIFIGDPDERLREDFLRILRFFRFNAWYGKGVDYEGFEACIRNRDGLSGISVERIWKEVKRTLEAPDPSEAMAAMYKSDIMWQYVISTSSTVTLTNMIGVEKEHGLAPDPMRRLMTLFKFSQSIDEISTRLKFSKEETTRLNNWARVSMIKRHRTPVHYREAFYRFGPLETLDYAVVEAARNDFGDLKQLMNEYDKWVRPKLPVGGKDITDMGFKGAEIGKTMTEIENIWINSDFTMDRQTLLTTFKNA
jgi:poly(A) polymerase